MNKELVSSDLVESIEQQADRIAGRVRNRMGCENVFVNIKIDQKMLSLGVSSEQGKPPPPREHRAADTVCLHTLGQGGILMAEDTRENADLAHLAYVKSGFIRAYLGYPIQDSEGQCFGALCAIATEPRRWTQQDIQIVEAAACEAGSLLAVQQLRNELSGLHNYLAEADRALMALSNSLTSMVSVHGEAGQLLFASSNLRQAFDEDSLVGAVRESLSKASVIRQLSEPESKDAALVRAREVRVRTIDGNRTVLSAQLRSFGSDTFYVYWTSGGSRFLN